MDDWMDLELSDEELEELESLADYYEDNLDDYSQALEDLDYLIWR